MRTFDGPDVELLQCYAATGEIRWLDELFGRHVAHVRNIVFPQLCPALARIEYARSCRRGAAGSERRCRPTDGVRTRGVSLAC
jgi:hypothetical protein